MLSDTLEEKMKIAHQKCLLSFARHFIGGARETSGRVNQKEAQPAKSFDVNGD